MAGNSESASASAHPIEKHSIDHVPDSERHGVVWHQGPFWFTGAFVIPSMLVGFIGPSLGLGLVYTLIAVCLGMAWAPRSWRCTPTRAPNSACPR